jgi:DNA-binding MarR family transcriptional regulator
MADTGRGNFNRKQLERLYKYLLRHPAGVSGQDLADFIGVTHARAMRILDVMDQNGYLTCIDGEKQNMLVFAYANVKNCS